jgi:hypothetical protein
MQFGFRARRGGQPRYIFPKHSNDRNRHWRNCITVHLGFPLDGPTQDGNSGSTACGRRQPKEEDGYGHSGLYGYSAVGLLLRRRLHLP